MSSSLEIDRSSYKKPAISVPSISVVPLSFTCNRFVSQNNNQPSWYFLTADDKAQALRLTLPSIFAISDRALAAAVSRSVGCGPLISDQGGAESYPTHWPVITWAHHQNTSNSFSSSSCKDRGYGTKYRYSYTTKTTDHAQPSPHNTSDLAHRSISSAIDTQIERESTTFSTHSSYFSPTHAYLFRLLENPAACHKCDQHPKSKAELPWQNLGWQLRRKPGFRDDRMWLRC